MSPAPTRRLRPLGFAAFLTLAVGQGFSLLGTGLTSFGLGVWVYQRSGSVTQFALITLAASLPGLFFAPLAGALVDRWDRKRTMLLSDAGAALCTVVMLGLLSVGALEIWIICALLVLNSIVTAFYVPVHATVCTILVPREHLARAGGITRLVEGVAQIAAPLVAGFLVIQIGLVGVMLIDLATFVVGMITVLWVKLPAERPAPAPQQSLWRESHEGFSYLRPRPGLLGLLLLTAVANNALIIAEVLVTPVVLRIASPAALGTILAASGIGIVAGSILMGLWGGPRNRAAGSVAATALLGLSVVGAGLQPSLAPIAVAAFTMGFWIPMLSACNQAVWQVKVPLHLQGRVFAVRHVLANALTPLGLLLTGPLVDRLFEPLLLSDGALAPTVGRLIGTGHGRGAALFLVLMGLSVVVVSAAVWLFEPVRRIDALLPDAPPTLTGAT